MSSDKITASLVIEVLGRPPEHIEETLREIIKKIDEEKGVSVVESKLNPSVEIQNQKGMFTTFAEIEVETKDLLTLSVLMFKYLPAHIEIISPENLKMNSFEVNAVLNELIMKIHKYDEVARILQMEKSILENQLKGIYQKIQQAKENKKAKENDKEKDSDEKKE